MSRHYQGGDRQSASGWNCPTCNAPNTGAVTDGCVECGAGRPRAVGHPGEAPVARETDPNAPIALQDEALVQEKALEDLTQPIPLLLPPPDVLEGIAEALATLTARVTALQAGRVAAEPEVEVEVVPEVEPLVLYTHIDGIHNADGRLSTDTVRTITAALIYFAQAEGEPTPGLLGTDATINLVTALSLGHGLET